MSHTEYDLLIANGTVIDTDAKTELKADVAVKGGQVVKIEPNIPKSQAAKVHDATGQYVCPGLIDMHTHVYWGSTYWGIEADPLAAKTGVTVSILGIITLKRACYSMYHRHGSMPVVPVPTHSQASVDTSSSDPRCASSLCCMPPPLA